MDKLCAFLKRHGQLISGVIIGLLVSKYGLDPDGRQQVIDGYYTIKGYLEPDNRNPLEKAWDVTKTVSSFFNPLNWGSK